MKIECEGLLFDMDGTLVDSSVLVGRIWAAWCRETGADHDFVMRVSHGVRTEDTLRRHFPERDMARDLAWLDEQERTRGDGLSEVAGAAALLGALPAGGWAVATSAARQVARFRLQQCGLPLPVHLVAAEDVRSGKPSPDPFREAATRLGLAPAACVAFEDADAGVTSALAAGCRVVIVGDHARDQPGVLARIPDYRGIRSHVRDGHVQLHLAD